MHFQKINSKLNFVRKDDWVFEINTIEQQLTQLNVVQYIVNLKDSQDPINYG